MAGLDVAPYDLAYELGEAGHSRVRALQAGKMELHDRGGPSGVNIPIVAYMVDAPGGRFVVDTGLGERWRDAPATEVADDGMGRGVRYLPRLDGPSLAHHLQMEGFAPDRVVCTHLHLDHAGGASELGLPVHASAPEVDAARRRGRGYHDEDLAPLDLRQVQLDSSKPVGPFPASALVADGVLALDTSGHTAGSMSLFLCLGPAWALVCGDAAYPLMDEPGSPAYLGMLRIRRFIDDMGGLVLAGHDTAILRACAHGAWLGGDP
jgi:glyoxylase-like metal-dependent hydrolase (beta-lactamase superfamily II)